MLHLTCFVAYISLRHACICCFIFYLFIPSIILALLMSYNYLAPNILYFRLVVMVISLLIFVLRKLLPTIFCHHMHLRSTHCIASRLQIFASVDRLSDHSQWMLSILIPTGYEGDSFRVPMYLYPRLAWLF